MIQNTNLNAQEEEKQDGPPSTDSTQIEVKNIPKNKHRKNLKMKAYCSKCYQFFQNGPQSKICQDHLKKDCSKVSCLKKQSINCIRKFPNINSANRHTHCLKQKDIINWPQDCDIQLQHHFLEKKRGNDKNSDEILEKERKSMKVNIEVNNKEKEESSQNQFKSSFNVLGIIDGVDNINFRDEPEDFEINQIFGALHEQTHDMNIIKHINMVNQNSSITSNDYFQDNNKKEDSFADDRKEIKDDDSVEQLYEMIQKRTNIPTLIKNKLIKAFKMKGIYNVRTFKLYLKENYQNFVKDFKKVTSQIEGVSYYLNTLFQINKK